MVTKKVISLSLLFALSPSYIQSCAAQSGDATFLKAKADREAQNTTATAPAATAAATTTTTPTTLIGQPYSSVVIDPKTQTEPFKMGIPFIKMGMAVTDGHGKGVRETSMAYIIRLTRDKRLTAALTDPIRTTEKTRERLSEAIAEGDNNLQRLITTQTLALKTFLDQQRTAVATFAKSKKSTTAALLQQQHTDLQQTTSEVDTVLQIVHNMSDANGSLSDACIKQELKKLKEIQRQKKEDLKLQHTVEADMLKELTTAFQEVSKQQESEGNAQIDRIYQLRELLYRSHPAPCTLEPLSPRKPLESATAASTGSKTNTCTDGRSKK
ncbi:MAG TPA: hypothetical protein VLG50_03160 [Candidatus Saccharimonadales bacterium]|nr:hypothetical protein [Candidatus Saccharimonadales bacterium]